MRRSSMVPTSRAPLSWPAWVRKADRFVAKHRITLALACILASFVLLMANHCHDTTPAFAQVAR